jgi:hypothetical protein
VLIPCLPDSKPGSGGTLQLLATAFAYSPGLLVYSMDVSPYDHVCFIIDNADGNALFEGKPKMSVPYSFGHKAERIATARVVR